MPRAAKPRNYHGGRASHGARWLARTLRENKLDGRTQIARMRRDLENALIDDLGGPDQVTTAQRLMAERAAATTLICSAYEQHVFGSKSPIGEDGSPLEVLKSYQTHVQGLSRLLQALGVQRIERPPLDLPAYLASRNTAQEPQRSRTANAAPATNTEATIDPDNATEATAADASDEGDAA